MHERLEEATKQQRLDLLEGGRDPREGGHT